MNYLELCQTLCREAGIPRDSLVDVQSCEDDQARVCGWVSQAWNELQLQREDWQWMRGAFLLPLRPGQSVYDPEDCDPPVTDMAKWHTETLVFIGNLSHRAVARLECVGPREFFGQGRAPELPNVYDVDAIQWDQFSWDSFLPGLPTGRPSKFSVLPDGRLAFNSVPDAVSMITGFYVKAPQTLSHNDDSPAFPEAFHSAIVYLALQKYAAYEAAPEVYAYAFDRYRYFLQRLERDQLPRITFCGAMA